MARGLDAAICIAIFVPTSFSFDIPSILTKEIILPIFFSIAECT